MEDEQEVSVAPTTSSSLNSRFSQVEIRRKSSGDIADRKRRAAEMERPLSASYLTLAVVPMSQRVFNTPGRFRCHTRSSHLRPSSNLFDRYRVPDEIIEEILSNLNFRDLMSAIQACRRFAAAGSKSPEWHGLDFREKKPSEPISEAVLIRILERGTRALRICGRPITKSFEDDEEVDWKSSLTHMDFSGVRMPRDASPLIHLLIPTTTLRCISLSGCHINDDVLTLLTQNTMISELDLSMCSGISPECLGRLVGSLSQLKQLNVNCTRIGKAGAATLVEMLPDSITHLDISGSGESDNPNDSIDDDAVIEIAERCPLLVELHLSDSPKITEESFLHLLELEYLRSLSVCRCYNIRPIIFLQATSLTVFSCFGCVTEQGNITLRERMPNTKVNEPAYALSQVARPTPPPSCSSIWGQRTRTLYS